jgi:D-serine deaminase-like pyridoxal phosphate-dependent protein
MATNGIEKILIANQVVTAQKLARVARLQHSAEVIICVDQPANIDMAAAAAAAEGTTIPLAIETNVGMDRAGVEPGEPVLSLARQIAATPAVRFAGIIGYEGHLLTIWPAADKERACREAMGRLIESRDLLVRDGLEVGIVSAGGSGTYMYSSLVKGVTEMEAGGGCFMDRFYVEDCHMDDLEVSMTVLATVTSRPTAGRGITDAGFKTVSGDEHLPSAIGLDGVEVVSLSAEHGELRLSGRGQQLTVGDQVEFMLGYSDTTAYHHDRIIGTRNGVVTDVFHMLGRGKLA